MNQSQEINEIAVALANVQKEALFALKDSNNPFFKSKYADLSSVWDVARKPLTDNGLSVAQPLDYDEDGVPVICTLLMHKSGQWIAGRHRMKPVKDDPQSVGSAITYGRRYSLAAMVGICPEDDDGNRATRNKSIEDQGKLPPKENKKRLSTQSQQKAIVAAGKKRWAHLKKTGFTDEDIDSRTIELCCWYRVGEHMTYDEASSLIKDFGEIASKFEHENGQQNG